MRTLHARLLELWGFLRATYAETSHHPLLGMAASVAFFALFALPPLLLLVIGVAGAVFGEEEAQARIVEQARLLAGGDGARMVGTMIEKGALPQARGWLAQGLGIAALLLGATGVFVQIQEVLNSLWHTNPARRRMGIVHVVLKRLLSFGVLLAIGFLLIVSLAFSAVMGMLGEMLAAALPEVTARVAVAALDLAASVTFMTLLFGAMFKVMPDSHVAWRQVWVGGATAAWLLLLSRTLVGLYLGQTDMGSAFGRAGSLAVLLVWIYVASLGLLLGAVVTRVHAELYQLEVGVPFEEGEGQRALPLHDGEEPAEEGALSAEGGA